MKRKRLSELRQTTIFDFLPPADPGPKGGSEPAPSPSDAYTAYREAITRVALAEAQELCGLRTGVLEAAHLPSSLRAQITGQPAILRPVELDGRKWVVIHRSGWDLDSMVWELRAVSEGAAPDAPTLPPFGTDTSIIQQWRDETPGLVVQDPEGGRWTVTEERREVITRFEKPYRPKVKSEEG